MQITAKVEGHDKISLIKETVERCLKVPIAQQRLILKGRALSDTQTIGDAGIVNGDKIFVMIKKAVERKEKVPRDEPEYDVKMWAEMWQFLLRHFTVDGARKVMAQYKKNYHETISGLSLDDIERLARIKQDTSSLVNH